MSEQKKRPVHEVILAKLESTVVEMVGKSWTASLYQQCVIVTLCEVLREITIPSQERENIVFRLKTAMDACWGDHQGTAKVALEQASNIVATEGESDTSKE